MKFISAANVGVGSPSFSPPANGWVLRLARFMRLAGKLLLGVKQDRESIREK